ncbi:MAG: hypothetical protein M1820_004134 [Bogoriella megaspora]|nr:MAG: hypothetical protein M1820_004134 [Bogoriella megaspora]
MPFDGTPSPACKTCKERKLKVWTTESPLTRPHCRKCISAGKDCPGVPDFIDQIFKESEPNKPKRKYVKKTTETKIEKKKVKESRILDPNIPGKAADDGALSLPLRNGTGEASSISKTTIVQTQNVEVAIPDHAKTSRRELIAPLLQNPPANREVQAIGNLFHSLQQIGFRFPVHGLGPFFRILAPLYAKAEIDSTLHQATYAVSALSLVERHKVPELQKNAFVAYGRAIHSLNKVVAGNSESTISDQTLMSTLLLSFCECYPTLLSSTFRYRKHLEGAISLLLLRGKEHYETPLSVEIFKTTRTQMVFNYIHRKKPLPVLKNDNGWILDDEDSSEDPLALLAVMVLDLPTLRFDADSLEEGDLPATAILDIIARAERIDSLLVSWYAKLPAPWLPHSMGISIETLTSPKTTQHWPGPIHNYCDPSAAYAVNCWRMFRTHIHQVILRAQNALERMNLSMEASALLITSTVRATARSRYMIQILTDDLCASVPFYLYEDFEDFGNLPKKPSNATRAHLLIHPLFVMSCVEEISYTQRAWMGSRLRFIMDMDKDDSSPVYLRDSARAMLGTALLEESDTDSSYQSP